MSETYMLICSNVRGSYYVELFEFFGQKEREAAHGLVPEDKESVAHARGATLADAVQRAVERMTKEAIR